MTIIGASKSRHDYAFKSLLESQFELRANFHPWEPAGYKRLPQETLVVSGSRLLMLLQDAQKEGGWAPASRKTYITRDDLTDVTAADARALAEALRVVAAGVARGEKKYADLCTEFANFAEASGGFGIAAG